ncbi:Uu.00g114990.m01.CDS01 [Anthostomella pinea]|uniref:Uu.00g114990.m01.CDS01 n=1 Tax=Anthostomella pinea TaxID=933095 RepID=A0AAI8VGQ0_9PEZI|nr:Uu.00g114990.m01.CDS01 [Anthostomella pinea]
MKPPTRIALRLAARKPQQLSSTSTTSSRLLLPRVQCRQIRTTPATPASVSPIHGTGPPPEPPQPAASSPDVRIERRRKQAALLEKAAEIRQQQRQQQQSSKSSTTSTSTTSGGKSPLARKRFWEHVHVRDVDGAWEVHLDKRPLRHPTTKQVVRLPTTKPLLAAALAHEWDMIVSAAQATRQHLIPLTGLVCRALDIEADDADAVTKARTGVQETLRQGVARMLLRYLDTDSLLCWAPPPRFEDGPAEEGKMGLRDTQKRAAEEVVAFLRGAVWPGVEIEPVLDGESIMPRAQPLGTREIIEGWIMGLSAFELAGLERATLAGKGLLGAVRLLVEWSEGAVGAGVGDGAGMGVEEKKFGVEEAARLASIEVDWQTDYWGEVEDTHDVEKEDLRRQLGSVILLVGGTGGN